jgi:hypothetical protein
MWCSVSDLVKRMLLERRDSPGTIFLRLRLVACSVTFPATKMDYLQLIIQISIRDLLPHMRMEEE